MNPKLIIASLTGISVLGGAIAGSYYYFNSETSQEKTGNSNSQTKNAEELNTKKATQGQESSAQSVSNPEKTAPSPAKPLAGGEGQAQSPQQDNAVGSGGSTTDGRTVDGVTTLTPSVGAPG